MEQVELIFRVSTSLDIMIIISTTMSKLWPEHVIVKDPHGYCDTDCYIYRNKEFSDGDSLEDSMHIIQDGELLSITVCKNRDIFDVIAELQKVFLYSLL